jgi:hypothetical protein
MKCEVHFDGGKKTITLVEAYFIQSGAPLLAKLVYKFNNYVFMEVI